MINSQFTNKCKQIDSNIYFTIEHSYGICKNPEGACLKIIPFLYDSQNTLLATLVIIEPKQYAGSAVLKRHCITDEKTEVYNLATKEFVPEETTLLIDIECKIIHLSGMGIKEKDIAKQLNLTLAMLKRIKAIIFEKLKVSSISEAIFVAYKRAYIDTSIETESE